MNNFYDTIVKNIKKQFYHKLLKPYFSIKTSVGLFH